MVGSPINCILINFFSSQLPTYAAYVITAPGALIAPAGNKLRLLMHIAYT